MVPGPVRALLLPVLLVLGFALLRETRTGPIVRLLRAQMALTAAALLPPLLASASGPKRVALLAAVLATIAEAAILPRLLLDETAPDQPERARARTLLMAAAGLLLTGWAFASVHDATAALPSAALRRDVAVALSIVLLSTLGLLRTAEAPLLLCRAASLGNAVLLLASAVPRASPSSIVAGVVLVAVTLLASSLLPRLAVVAPPASGRPAP